MKIHKNSFFFYIILGMNQKSEHLLKDQKPDEKIAS